MVYLCRSSDIAFMYLATFGLQQKTMIEDIKLSLRRITSFRLQVLENRVLRMKLNQSDNSNTSCKDLVRMTGDMSIHQLMAYFTLLQMHKTVTTQKPSYLANKLVLRKPTVDERVFPHRQLNCINLDDRNMTISRSGFICRGAKIWKEKSNSFMSGVKHWIKEYVSVKSP